jgi:hypothetical protein
MNVHLHLFGITYPTHNAPVAQLDRVPGYELGGRRFESFRARHIKRGPLGPFLIWGCGSEHGSPKVRLSSEGRADAEGAPLGESKQAFVCESQIAIEQSGQPQVAPSG